MKAVLDVTSGISIVLKLGPVIDSSRPLPIRCGSGTNQAEAGGHVTPEAVKGGEWFSSWQLLGKIESHQNERDPEAV
ncbi:hypothetical protein MTR_2g073130 [Medicago truncatula]|uniref:Uncharacterized protein n=1 Tax=Medicago truncatula TaxID=3880 RepID=A0A072VK60_MEDTR|nr:hypothetical protein MTR_2g073130 [Medicago truncatula]